MREEGESLERWEVREIVLSQETHNRASKTDNGGRRSGVGVVNDLIPSHRQSGCYLAPVPPIQTV